MASVTSLAGGHLARDFEVRDNGQVNIGDHHHHETSTTIHSLITGNTIIWHTNTAKSQTVFDWFSTIKYWLHHQNMCKDIHIDSGKWLLSKEEFASWASSLQSSVLWLHGIPGSGKSKLVAQVIDHMKSKFDQSTGTIAYFYCLRDVAEDERSRPEEVIRSILRQLSFKGKNPKVLKEPASLYYQKKVDEAEDYGSDVIDRLTWEECIELLISLLEGSTTVIIIDAIDELKKEERWILYEAFDRILDHPRQGLVRIFVSSRDDGDIVMKLSAYKNVYISATDNQDDIERFVNFEVQKAISCHRLLRGSVSDSLKTDIVATLTKGAQGMFRWVSLQIQALCSSQVKTPKSVRKMLGSLPKTLEESYDVVYCQLIDLDEETRIIAENAIRWLLCSKRQLLSSELIAALSINDSEGSPTDEDEEVMDADELLDLCCNLIILDKSLDTFRMAHLSVREYFEKKVGYEHVRIHTMATSACLNSLTASFTLDSGAPLVQFQSYATIFWLNHCSEIGPEGPTGQLKNVAKLFLFEGCEASPLFIRWANTVHAVTEDSKSFTLLNEQERRKLHDAASIPPHPLFLAGSFSFVWVLEELFNYKEFDFDRKRDDGHCCVILAAALGHKSVVEALLRHGTDVNIRGEANRTALNQACMYGHKEVAEFLIANGADVDARIDAGWIPLHEAVWHSNYDSVLLILQAGGDVDAQQSLGWTPLMMAAQNKRDDIAKLLLTYNPDFTIQDKKGFTAMHHADAGVIRLLLAQGAKPSDPVHKTVLISQTNASRVDAVLLLIEEGVDLNSQDENNKAAIDHAIETGVPEVLDILVTHNARSGLKWDVNSHHIAQWKEETWFPRLLDILSSSNATAPAPFVPMSGSNHHVLSDSEAIITMDSPDVPYLWIRVPAEMTFVTRIKFTTESHDQGWSNDAHIYRGTYHQSYTWFEAGTTSDMPRRTIQCNVHAVAEYTTHVNIWDAHNADKETSDWLVALRPGHVVQVFPKAAFPGWVNYVKKVEIEIEGISSPVLKKRTTFPKSGNAALPIR